MPVKLHAFANRAQVPPAMAARPGKPEWPDMLRIGMKRGHALDMIGELAASLRGGDDEVFVTLFGELAEYVEDERCPTCDSPAPNLHPAMQHEGEVQPCRDPWHGASGGEVRP